MKFKWAVKNGRGQVVRRYKSKRTALNIARLLRATKKTKFNVVLLRKKKRRR